jgi:hypothetical protein
MGQALASNPLFTLRFPLAGAFLLLITGELVYRALALRKLPSITTTATDTFIWVVEGAVRGLSIGLRWLVFSWVAQFAPLHLEASWWSGILAYLIIDFVYYWKHRFFHSTKLGWALHSTHHTTRQLTFLSTLRLNWIEAFLSYYFFLPLALVGFDPLMLFFLIEINDAWQVVCLPYRGFRPHSPVGALHQSPRFPPGASLARSQARQLQLHLDADPLGQALRHLSPACETDGVRSGRRAGDVQPVGHPVRPTVAFAVRQTLSAQRYQTT